MSRSYLQSDTAVKKISGYITKKVAERLDNIFKNDRADFEKKWDDIKIFIEYGMLTDQKFGDAAMKFGLLRDTEGKYFTFEEYRKLIEGNQTDKDGNVVYIYSNDPAAQYNYIHAAQEMGYNVLLMDGQLDSHFIGMLESKIEKTRFTRVDSDIAANLVPKDERKESGLSQEQTEVYSAMFRSQVAKTDKAEFFVTFEELNADANPVMLTQNEYMRRMKEMAAMQPGMNFYGELPDSYNLIVNTGSPLIKKILKDSDEDILKRVKPMTDAIADADKELRQLHEKEKSDSADADADKKHETHLEETMTHARNEREKLVAEYAAGVPLIKQVIDLALLANGLLKGAELSEFIRRSVGILEGK